MGLNESYTIVRGNILVMAPLLSLNQNLFSFGPRREAMIGEDWGPISK